MYVNAAIFIFGAPYTLMTDGHVRVDVFYSRLGEKGKSFVNALGTLLLLMPAMILIILTSEDYVRMSWQIFERSPESSGLPFVYLLKTLILVIAAPPFSARRFRVVKVLSRIRHFKCGAIKGRDGKMSSWK